MFHNNKYCVIFEDGETLICKSDSLFQVVTALTTKYDRVISITKLPDEDHDMVYTV